MTGKDFTAWLDHMGFKDAQAARALGGMSRNSIKKYKDEGAPYHIGLACAALAYGLPPWKAPETT
ncbi:MAG: hypothetical protein CMH91_07570 [Oceanicaulis sp.]|jgi:hypothetical protein|uniref:hypothetical protein n=1 Tax=unclassified Oceanicaulis TaxID=2632123 RepID=UPI000C3BDA5C|nr:MULTISPECIES: hypothetical protein [unclassified Oceanicaulis]MBC38906.1 hypothetical protein [Oceanicaulis sp.]|tara:strand:- start:1992 stop:2186 length:195 start_codon:yes stop_codon:yes gene_type:complete